MGDREFLSLCWIASIVYDGDIESACEASQQFEATRHVNVNNLRRILYRGFELNERTLSWLVGSRKMPVSQFAQEVAETSQVHRDIRKGWVASVLIRRSLL
jgi:hypothetical protein